MTRPARKPTRTTGCSKRKNKKKSGSQKTGQGKCAAADESSGKAKMKLRHEGHWDSREGAKVPLMNWRSIGYPELDDIDTFTQSKVQSLVRQLIVECDQFRSQVFRNAGDNIGTQAIKRSYKRWVAQERDRFKVKFMVCLGCKIATRCALIRLWEHVHNSVIVTEIARAFLRSLNIDSSGL